VIAAALVIGLGATAGVLEYNAAKGREEAARIDAEAQRRTKRQIAEVGERAKAGIRFFAQWALATRSPDLPDRVLPTLVWIQLLSDSPVLPEDARVPSVAEREQLLRAMVEEVRADHREDHVDAMLATYALAYFLVEQGQSEEPRALLEDLRRRWFPKLDAGDPICAGVHGLEGCAAANEALARGTPAEQVRDQLQAVHADMDREGRCEPVRRLCERLLKRLGHPQK
jgi:hypothetical protein